MPPVARPLKRAITNENDENVGTTRLTRAKAAALTGNENEAPPKKALQTKKTTSNTLSAATGGQVRRRAALGDVSNVVKGDVGEGKDGKEVKKPLASKTGLVSKAAQPSRVQKTTKTTTSRSILQPKDKNNTASELKRPASGSGATGPVTKKRHTGSSTKSIVEEDYQDSENIAPEVNRQTTKTTVKVEIEKQVERDEVKVEPLKESSDEMILDLDEDDREDPLMVAEYVHEIFDYLKELELRTLPNEDYMDMQGELEWKMRGILIDWLLEVHTRFRLLPETLFLAVNIIDRFLSAKVVQLDRLQLVGVTAMFIASKYEEVLSPHVQNFRHVADDGFTEDEILSAERFVLAALNYDLSYPNPMNFLRRISKADNYDIHTRTVGKYLLEISCLEHKMIKFPPSQIAAASMYMARLILNRGEWDATIAHYAGYTAKEIEPVLELMIQYISGPVIHEAFFKKYASKKFYKASIFCRKWAKEFVHEHGDVVDVDGNARPGLPSTGDEEPIF
ncbi:A/B/D/E cyclin [Pseudovirgaria hyperparasitica]|uniref:A/B/D/E cyclin n=1 Tax=Pseudovirgaria hyperparasitica TaxID=470096 RepID=A0A6A6WIS2_9PEZI|nr:A/B/D/E cyclin [Pseudovirgaria hyperparasitica]KAF2761976.1 A/B/D/E cyclin [Pseudovirgaria hyperparasitica]